MQRWPTGHGERLPADREVRKRERLPLDSVAVARELRRDVFAGLLVLRGPRRMRSDLLRQCQHVPVCALAGDAGDRGLLAGGCGGHGCSGYGRSPQRQRRSDRQHRCDRGRAGDLFRRHHDSTSRLYGVAGGRYRPPVERPLPVNRRVLAQLSYGHFATDLPQGALPALLPLFKSQYHLSYTDIGVVVLIANISSSIIQPAFGVLSDRVRMRWLMPAGALIAGAGMVLAVSATNFGVMMA